MISTKTNQMKSRIDEILSDGELDERALEGLRDLLYPDGPRDQWPDVSVVLHLLQQEVIKEAIEKKTIDEELARVIVALISAISPLLGFRPIGPLANQADHFRRRYEREERKYKLVAERIGDRSEDEVESMLMAYLDTAPAPFFLMRLRQRHEAILRRAEDALKDEEESWSEEVELIGLLETCEGDPDMIRQELVPRLEALHVGPFSDVRRLGRGLNSTNPKTRLIASAVAVYGGHHQLTAHLLEHVVHAHPHAPQLVVFSALLDPALTRHALSAFLIDVVWGNPEEPEAEWTPLRQEAALAARTILPRIGSPLPNVDKMPPTSSETPRQVEWFYDLWQDILYHRGQ
ncbi:MAG: hypothetical protein ACNA8W_00335 [Bradymonadaceae bacterium]